jgi:hypothetical protein
LKIVYIAGPYIGNGHYLTVERNIREAEAFAIELTKRRIGFLCPHLNSAHFQIKTDAPASFWYEMDLAILLHCDGIAFSPRWQESSGCKLEMEYAKKNGIQIFYWDELDEIEHWVGCGV